MAGVQGRLPDTAMSHHASYALPAEFLDIVLIEDSKPMQMILRSMLAGLHARRIRLFDNASDALQAMLREPPNLILTDHRMPGMSGLDLVRLIRSPNMAPLCFVPVIVITAHATLEIVEETMRAGAQLLLVKPIAPAVLLERIQWLTTDSRQLMIGIDGNYGIEGMSDRLAVQKSRSDSLRKARQHHEKAVARQAEKAAAAENKPAPPGGAEPAKAAKMAVPQDKARPAAPAGKPSAAVVAAGARRQPFAALRT